MMEKEVLSSESYEASRQVLVKEDPKGIPSGLTSEFQQEKPRRKKHPPGLIFLEFYFNSTFSQPTLAFAFLFLFEHGSCYSFGGTS